MKKRLMRKVFRERVISMSAEQRSAKSCEAIDRLIHSGLLSRCRSVALYNAMLGEEVDTAHLVRELRSRDVQCSVPLIDGKENTMRMCQLTDETRLNRFGIAEPPLDSACVDDLVDAVVAPGLAFSRCGARLGRGNGYYDRWLGDRQQPPTKHIVVVGLCFDVQLVNDDDDYDWHIVMEPHDVRMQHIATNREIITVERN
jgi:5-formyltetrahydrofolate cyclo-ligase